MSTVPVALWWTTTQYHWRNGAFGTQLAGTASAGGSTGFSGAGFGDGATATGGGGAGAG